MLKRILSIVLAGTLALSVAGCKADSDVDTQSSKEINLGYTAESTEMVPKASKVMPFKIHEIAPITKDGKTAAQIVLNQSERLGIFDWTSAASVDSGIKHSFTFNFKVNYFGKLKNGENVTFYVKPKFVNSKTGKTVGDSCIVGWSGFPKTAVFSNKTTSTYIEYGVQPLKKLNKDTVLVLNISDSNGNTYDDVIYDHSVISKAKKGPSLRTSDDAVTVTGASGAKYKINVYGVYLEQVFPTGYTFHYESDVEEVSTTPALMFNYRVDYLKGPKSKKIEVSNIDTSKKSSMLSTDLKIGVQSNTDNTMYYDRNTNYTRFIYSNSLRLEAFTTNKHFKIHPGTYAYYTENRPISDSFMTSTSSIRFSVELSSDAMAMTPEKLMKFNGRFLVFERTPGSRPVYKRKTHKRPYAFYTNDNKHE